MRFGVLLLVGLGLFSLAHCTANTSDNLVCESAAGMCLPVPEGGLPANCGEQLTGAVCDPGFICCSGTPENSPTPPPSDAATVTADGSKT
jgi:hypothetical protein